MRGRPVDQMVYEAMFPRPKSSDPANFHALLQRSLIPEVRQETHAYYGHLDTQEAKYPGLDYTNPTHRMRLSRFQYHRKLFRAFDNLGLTNAEIAGLTKWEGTKWAKEKYEREQGIKIVDTADEGMPNGDDIPNWLPRRRLLPKGGSPDLSLEYSSDNENNMDVESDDDELESVGVPLNERLRAQAARREAGDDTAVLDEEWEQWLKNVLETGDLDFLTELLVSSDNSNERRQLLPPGVLDLARNGRWAEVPEILHSLLRRALEAERQSAAASSEVSSVASPTSIATPTPTQPSSLRRHYLDDRIRTWQPRRTYSDLRLPEHAGPAHRAAEASGA